MAQTYTLEEAANRLGLSQEEFKRRIKDEWKAVRSFRDGPTLRFRATDIDELARQLGEASDPGFQLGPVGSEAVESTEALDVSDHFSLSDEPAPAKKASVDEPLLLPTDPEEEPSFQFDIDPGQKAAKTGADSSVRVDVPSAKLPESHQSQLTDEINLDLSGPGSAIIRPGQLSGTKLTSGLSGNKLAGPMSSTKLSGPPSGKIPSPTSGRVNPDDGSSEFELNLDPDSDSFELKLGHDSDEADIGLDLSPPPGTDRGGLSGINLGKPADSGLSLESRPASAGPKTQRGQDSDLDFELSLEGKSDVKTSRTASPGSGKKNLDSDSEFELTLDDNSGVVDKLGEELLSPASSRDAAAGQSGDIFETDFELPVMSDASDSQVVAVDNEEFSTGASSSEYDLAIDDADAPADEESASQVVLVEDDIPEYDGGESISEEDVIVDVAVEEGASASKALRGVRADDYDDEEDYEVSPAVSPVLAPAPWGALPVVILFPCLLLTFLGALMSFELLRGMWGYQQPTPPGNLIVRGMADAFGLKTAD